MTFALTAAHTEIIIGREHDGVRVISTQCGPQQNGIHGQEAFFGLLNGGIAHFGASIGALDHGILCVGQKNKLVQVGGGRVERGQGVGFVGHERVVLVGVGLAAYGGQSVEL